MKKLAKVLFALLLAAALGFAAFWFTRPADVSFDQFKTELPHFEFSRFADIDGVKIHYQEKGEGQPIVLIHGLAASTYTWKSLFDPLSKHFRVIAIDLKGFGFSAKPDGDYSRREQARIVIGLMNHLKIEKAILAGNSMGGETAMNIAVHEPDRVSSLILINSAGVRVAGGGSLVPLYLQIPYVNRGLSALALISDRLVRKGLEKSYFDDSKITNEAVRSYHRPLQGTDGQRAVMLARQQFAVGDLGTQIAEINLPALIIWGAEDEVIPVEAGRRIHEMIKGSQLRIYEKVGHVPQEETPEKVLQEMLKFTGKN